MMGFSAKKDYVHGTPQRLGILVANLGTPDAPDTRSVRKYLAEFLWDPRVVEVPRPIWWLILHLVILRVRPSRSAHAYEKVWTPEGSPLLVWTHRQAAALAARLSEQLGAPPRVEVGMRYGSPSIPEALRKLRDQDVRRLLVLPLYPQYSGSTTASVFDAVADELQTWRWLPELRFVNDYHDDPGYIAALAASVREYWASQGRSAHLVLSFHGVPQRYLKAGDPYHCACQKTGRMLAEALGLGPEDWSLSFQSRVGREEWLRPYTDEHLGLLARNGTASVDVVCPGFSADCLETLEEIAMQNAELFEEAGGERLVYIPALNDRPDHIAALANLVNRHIQGWPEAAGSHDEALIKALADEQRSQARRMEESPV
jgi:ferrochelatase